MKLFNNQFKTIVNLISRVFVSHSNLVEQQFIENYDSKELQRIVKLEVLLPPQYFVDKNKKYPVLLINDGQDFDALEMIDCLNHLYIHREIPPLIVVGVYAFNRIAEYGTANQLDYKGRGHKAEAYQNFIVKELIPFLHLRYRCNETPDQYTIAGFSLGGLSAFDTVWNHSAVFKNVGVFSGSLWWRSKAFKPEDPDANRIVHEMVINSNQVKPGLKFWFQAGTKDEEEDRNNNGIIDAIDDTVQLTTLLEQKGYPKKNIRYVQVEGGEHNPSTWGKIMPDFLKWIYG